MQIGSFDKRNFYQRGTWALRGLMLLAATVLGFALYGCGGGGGGGGPTGGNATVVGRVLRAETGTRPDPAATITIGGVSGQSSATDGTFSLTNVPSGATTVTITASGAQTRTFTATLTANQSNDLGDVFLSDTGYNAKLIGRVVAVVNNAQQAVANATVVVTGVQTQTDNSGNFSISNLPVGLGTLAGQVVGKVTATGFEEKPITSETLEFPLTAGDNALTNPIVIAAPVGTTPLPPYTITGTVNLNGQPGSNALVILTTSLGGTFRTNADANGVYFFWIVPGTYNISGQIGTATNLVSVTLTSPGTPVTAPTINLSL